MPSLPNLTREEIEDELQRLREAVWVLANACGAHVISQQTGQQLSELLTPPEERKPK